VAHADREFVVRGMPEERDLEAVVDAVGQFSRLSVECGGCHLRLLVGHCESLERIAVGTPPVSVASRRVRLLLACGFGGTASRSTWRGGTRGEAVRAASTRRVANAVS